MSTKNTMIFTENNTMAGIGFIIFGSIVHVSNHFMKTRKRGEPFYKADAAALLITSAFSGSVYSMIALLITNDAIHIILAGAVGAFLGVPGLTRATDIVMSILARKAP